MSLAPLGAGIPVDFMAALARGPGSDAGGENEDFAQLLAALLGTAAGPDLAPPTSPLELAVDADPPAPSADMFNGPGFFQGLRAGAQEAPAAPSPGPEAEARAEAEAQAPLTGPLAALPDAGSSLHPAAGPQAAWYLDAAPGAVATPMSTHGRAAAVQGRQAAPAATPAKAGHHTAAPSAEEPGQGEGQVADPSEGPEAAPPRAPPRTATGGGALETLLTLQAAEREVSLTARLERLSREERERLRSEIVQLLAAYGFSAGEIRLNGRAGPAR